MGNSPCFGGIGKGGGVSNEEPIKVTVLGAAGQIGYSLLPMIANGDMFGPNRRVILRGLDLKLQATMENMRAIEMELNDGNFPLLFSAQLTTSDSEAFKDAEYAILLGAFPRQEGREEREIMDKNVTIFRTMGNAIENHASKNCKVLVTGNPANTNAYIVAHYAPKLPKENFFCLSRLDQNRAAGQIASKAKVIAAAENSKLNATKNDPVQVTVNDVQNIIVWGKHCSPPDVEQCTVKGKPVSKLFSKKEDKEWLEKDFPSTVMDRGMDVQKARKATSAMSVARSICDHMRDLHCGTRSGEHVSMGVWSGNPAGGAVENPYGITGGLFYSMPVTCSGGNYKIKPGLKPTSPEMLKMIKSAQDSLVAEKALADKIIQKHEQTTRPMTSEQ